MKRIFTFVIVFVMMLSLSACGEEKVITREDTPETSNETSVSYVFKFGDVEIPILAKSDEIIAKLGDPISKYEAPSCAFGEMDVVYTYAGVEIGTYQENGENFISYVLLKDDTVSTQEGLFIGSERSQVETLYGTPTSSEDTSYTYLTDDMKFVVFFEDDEVTSIEYLNIVLD